MTILLTISIYFGILLLISRLVGKGGNDAFFRGNRNSPWPIVAIGMVGASLSGVTFVSVPGMVMSGDMTYIQMCLGFIVGYFVIAFVLLPLYYKYGLTSIYSYLGRRFGGSSRKTGSIFFLISKLTGAAARLSFLPSFFLYYLVERLLLHRSSRCRLQFSDELKVELFLEEVGFRHPDADAVAK